MAKRTYVSQGYGAEQGMEVTPKQMAASMKRNMDRLNSIRTMVGLKPKTNYSKQIKKLR